MTVAIEANECFKQTTEIPSDGHLYTDDVSAAQLPSLAACRLIRVNDTARYNVTRSALH